MVHARKEGFVGFSAPAQRLDFAEVHGPPELTRRTRLVEKLRALNSDSDSVTE